ncbi:MAG: T9SS type A sorting domain-containing protein [Segetibacter sp.]
MAGTSIRVTITVKKSATRLPAITTNKNTGEINSNEERPWHLGAYPNPGNGWFTVRSNGSKAEKAEVLIINATGVIVETRRVQLTGKAQTLDFNLSNKASGCTW